MSAAPAILSLLTRIAEALESPVDARRRGYGPANLLGSAGGTGERWKGKRRA